MTRDKYLSQSEDLMKKFNSLATNISILARNKSTIEKELKETVLRIFHRIA
jgi:chaperonin cofactor prefoldin